MAGLFSILNVANSGLEAQQFGAQTAAANVANASTPGYSRVDVTMTPSDDALPIDGGVSSAKGTNAADTFLASQQVANNGISNYASTQQQYLQQVTQVLAPTTGDTVGTQMDSFFSAVSQLSSDPSSVSLRQGVLSSASALATQFNTTSSSLTQISQGINQQVSTEVEQANNDASQIASLNGQISVAEANGTQASTLRDQRTTLVNQLSSLIGGSALTNSQGQVQFLAAGKAIVDGTQAYTLSTAPTGTNGANDIVVSDSQGHSQVVTSQVTSGTIGALVNLRDTTIAGYQTQLNQLATDVSTQVNAVQSAGVGLDGVSGRNMFASSTASPISAANITVSSDVAGQPNNVAAATTAAGLPGDNTNATAMANLATQNVASGGTTTFDGAYNGLSTTAAEDTQSATSAQTDATDRQTFLTNLQQSETGVSTDEEMTQLEAYQNAYQASAQVIKTIDTMFDALMEVGASS